MFRKAVFEILGREMGDKFISEIALYGSPKKMPAELKHSLVLTEVKMYWNKEAQAFLSYGKLGLGYSDKSVINRKVTGYAMFQNKRDGAVKVLMRP